jgi:hypothetical protein
MKPTPVTIRAATRRLLLQAAMGGHRTRLPPLLLEGDRRAEQQRVKPLVTISGGGIAAPLTDWPKRSDASSSLG